MPCFYSEDELFAPTGAHAHTDHNFSLPGDTPHYPPDRPVDIRHIGLNLHVDFNKKSLSGTCTTTMMVLFDEISTITLQATEMIITSVQFSSRRRPQLSTVEWDYDGEHLHIHLDKSVKYGAEVTVAIAYSTQPRIGMNFVGPLPGDPDLAIQAHTQGQPEYAHYWFPCHDSPNERATMAVAARVPADYFAVSNGRLEKIEEHPESSERTFFYFESVPFPAYIATLAVADFTEIRDSFGEIPVLYYVRPGFEENARLMMGDTPAMLAYYSEKFGIRYPYEKYAQVILEQFSGAMENTSATSHTWLLLPDQRYLPDWGGKSTVAHELVHQWFGDLLTCRDWSHAWLNESFATYFEETWKQVDPTAGELEFRLGMRLNQQLYLAEDHTYRRPIVYNVYHTDGQELFDRHLYEKGSCVLHMLRSIVGEAAFWRAIQHYARTNRGREVITADLERAFEVATGRSVAHFFEQWVYRGGHPEFDVSYNWDDEHRLASLTVKQTQQVNELTPLFTTPIEVAFTIEQRGRRETKTYTINISSEQETYVFPCDRRPLLVRFDPYGWVLKSLKFELPVAMLRWQLANDSDPIGRLDAAAALSKHSDTQSVTALIAALNNDTFWAVQAEAARSLGGIHTAAALTALIGAATTVQHSKARLAVVSALGEFRLPEHGDAAVQSAATLTAIIQQGDVSYLVEAEAGVSLGKTRTPGAFATLEALAQRPSWQNMVTRGALAGMGYLATHEAIQLLTTWLTDMQHPLLVRQSIPIILRIALNTHLIEESSSDITLIRTALLTALEDPWEGTVRSAVVSLRTLQDASTIPALEHALDVSLESRTQRQLRQTLLAIREGKRPDGEVRRVRRDVESLREENRKLRERLTLIEGRLNTTSDTASESNGHNDLAATIAEE